MAIQIDLKTETDATIACDLSASLTVGIAVINRNF